MSMINVRQISGIPDDIEAQIAAMKQEIESLKTENQELKEALLTNLTSDQIDAISKSVFQD